MVDRRRRALPGALVSHADRILYLEALLLFPLIAASLRMLGLGRTRSWLHTVSKFGRPRRAESHADLAAHTAEVVAAAAATGPYQPSCLRHALALETVLRQRGVDAELKLGVRRPAGEFSAHAWVEHNGVALASNPDPGSPHETYSVLASFPTQGVPPR